MAAVVVGFNSHSKRNPIHLGGDTYQVVGEITTDGGDYASGGFALTASLFGLDYIDAVYGSPCGAWAHSQSYNWY